MAMIQGPGNFSGKPISKNFVPGEAKKAPEQGPEAKESFVPSGAVVPQQVGGSDTRVQTPTEVNFESPVEVPKPGAATVQTQFSTPATPRIPAEFDGAFLTGPGMSGLQATSSIGASEQTAGLSESVFTNGLSSTKFVGISGRTLVEFSPWK